MTALEITSMSLHRFTLIRNSTTKKRREKDISNEYFWRSFVGCYRSLTLILTHLRDLRKILFLAVLGFELRTLHFLGRHSTLKPCSQSVLLQVIFKQDLMFMPRPAWTGIFLYNAGKTDMCHHIGCNGVLLTFCLDRSQTASWVAKIIDVRCHAWPDDFMYASFIINYYCHGITELPLMVDCL
jgi:hypothetical protein